MGPISSFFFSLSLRLRCFPRSSQYDISPPHADSDFQVPSSRRCGAGGNVELERAATTFSVKAVDLVPMYMLLHPSLVEHRLNLVCTLTLAADRASLEPVSTWKCSWPLFF
ncbi:hypothetical protein R3P38DRAFT_3342077 [Favolaschia claudopus]|uniref:Secreted protein n=1 Tax=Favolaschia claudopus TaxID=2862362 RepID=A0AAW0E2D6_9AGAR